MQIEKSNLKFYEAMELGHTLIEEDHGVFYDQDPQTGEQCGCAIGSALKAAGHENAINVWEVVETLWPWTKRPLSDFPELKRKFEVAYNRDDINLRLPLNTNVAWAVSLLHIEGTPRLEIAKLIKPIEDNLPENQLDPAGQEEKTCSKSHA